MNIDLFMPARLISGEHCVRSSNELIGNLGRSCLIVTGGSSAQLSGALNELMQVLDAQKTEYTVFSEIKENPLLSDCLRAGACAREVGAEYIVGIGGGSPLDAAKAVAIYAANPSFSEDDIYTRSIPAAALPVVLIGTTSGTGSEVTGVSVLTQDSSGRKKSISGADCYAAISFLDSRYTHSMPYSVTVSTALDALAHSVEGWFSPKCSEIAKSYAVLALPRIFSGLRSLYRTGELPDAKGRKELYFASIYAGLQLNICGAAFPHTVGYVLTEDFGIPHGRACTAFMPALLARASMYCPERLRELYSVMGTDEGELLEVVNILTDVNVGISLEVAQEYCERWSGGMKNFINSPGGFSSQDALAALMSL